MMGRISLEMDLPISPPSVLEIKQTTSYQSSSSIHHRIGSITSSATENATTPVSFSSTSSTTATLPHLHLNALHRSAAHAHYQKQTRVSSWRESVSHVNGTTVGGGEEGTLRLQVEEFAVPLSCKAAEGNGADSPASLSATTSSSEEEQAVPRMQVQTTTTRSHAPQLQTRGSTFSIPPSRSGSGFGDLQPSIVGAWQCATARGRSTDRERPIVPSFVENVARSASQPNERQATPCAGKVAQAEQKKALAEKMVDSVHDLLCSTWSSASEASSSLSSSRSTASEESTPLSTSECERSGLVPLRMFIREILRRSKSSCGTLRCAEWYLTRLRSTLIPAYGVATSDAVSSPSSSLPCKTLATDSPLLCPRRAFLAALVLAHKFLHDRVYSNRAWAKVSGLDVKEIGRGELALASILDWNLWVGREEEVAALKADATSAVPLKPTWFSDVATRKETMPAPVAPAVPTIASWRAGVRQQSPESVSPSVTTLHSSIGVQYVTSSPDAMAASRETPTIGHGEAMHPSHLNYRSCGLVSTKGSFDSVSPSHPAACAATSQGSASTLLSSCLPGLTLDGRSDFDGSASVSNISPQSWVLVGIPEVQIMEDVVEEGEDSSRRLSVSHLHLGQGANPKKRGSPLAADAIAQEATTCEHDWVDATVVDIHAMKKRKVAVGVSGGQSRPRAYFC